MSLPIYQAFGRRLAELGFVEGKNLEFVPRWAEGQVGRLPGLIADVVAARPDVIYVLSSAAAVAAKKANLDIPVVFSHVTDPVASGVVVALARHDGNITGVTYSIPDVAGKLLQLLRELRPSLRYAGVLWTKGQPGKIPEVGQLKLAAATFNVDLVLVEASGASDYAKLVDQDTAPKFEALVVLADPLNFRLRSQITRFAAKHVSHRSTNCVRMQRRAA